MLRSLTRVSGLRLPGGLSAPRPAFTACSSRGFSVKEAGRTSGGPTVDPEGQEATAMDSTVDELAKSMGSGAKVPFGAGPDASDTGGGVRNEGEAGVARKVQSVRREAPAERVEDEVAGGAERLKGTPRDDSGLITPEGAGKGDIEKTPGKAGTKPLKGEGHGPRGWGAAESDSEAPPKGVVLE